MATLTQLEYIVMVDKTRHFGDAAKACHVSQPSLSAQIQKVEDELNLIIFDRQKSPVVTTDKGSKFIEQARSVLREHKRLLQLAKHHEVTPSGEFKLGVIPTVSPYLVHLFIEDFSKTYPKVNLTIEELTTETILNQLKKDTLDAGILATPLHEQGLHERLLYYEDFYVYVSPKHPLSKKRIISENDLDKKGLWLLQEGHCLRTQVLKFCALKSNGEVYSNVFFQSGSLETLRNLIRNGDGYTVLPESFIRTLDSAERKMHVRIFKSPTPTREISLIHRRDQWKLDILLGLEKSIKTHLPKELSQKPMHKRILEL